MFSMVGFINIRTRKKLSDITFEKLEFFKVKTILNNEIVNVCRIISIIYLLCNSITVCSHIIAI